MFWGAAVAVMTWMHKCSLLIASQYSWGVIKLHAQRCIIICTSTSEASVFELVLQAFMQKQCCELALR